MPGKGWGVGLAAALALTACGPGGGAKLVGADAFRQVHMVDALHGWGLSGIDVLTTADGGATWATAQLPRIDTDLLTAPLASFPTPSAAWLCQAGSTRGAGPQQAYGDYLFQRYPSSRCVVTADAGRTWSAHDVPGTDTGIVNGRNRDTVDLVDVTALDATTALGVIRSERVHTGGGQESDDLVDLRVIRTTDAGRTWTTVLDRAPQRDGPPDSLGAPRIEMAGRSGWMVDWIPGVLEHTGDGGLTWQAAPLPDSLGAGWNARRARLGMPSLAPGPAVAVPVITEGVAGGPATVILARSDDGGRTWRVTAPQTCRSFCTDWGAADAPDRVVGDGAALLVTRDGGVHWRRAPIPLAFAQLRSVQMLTPSQGWAVGYTPNSATDLEQGEPLHTTDGGLTWTALTG